MRKKGVISILFGLMILSPALFGTNYYIDTNSGNDSSPGTLSLPWRTIDKANETLRAGDTVYIKAGIYTGNQNRIYPENSGTSWSNSITFTNYNGGKVTIRGNNHDPCVQIISSRHHIRIIGLDFTYPNQASCNINSMVWIDGDYILFQNCEVAFGKQGTVNEIINGVTLDDDSSYCIIRDCKVHDFGRPEGWGGGNNGTANCIRVRDYSHHHLIERNESYNCGHDPLLMFGHHCVVRNNNLHNETWGKGMTADYTGSGFPEMLNVYENNDVHGCTGLEPWPNGGVQFNQYRSIFRRNRCFRNNGGGIQMSVSNNDIMYAKDSRIYNNVFHDNGQYPAYSEYRYGIRIRENPEQRNFDGMVIKNNIFWENPSGGIGWLIYANSNDHDVRDNHNQDAGNPRFVDSNRGNYTLRADSPCIDAGGWLTLTTTSGTGTRIPIEDVYYFCDGFGIAQGDEIQLQGQAQSARIIRVDYSGSRIEVDRSMTWQSGQGVALAYDGSAPDIGAHEFEDGGGGGGEVVPLDADADASPHSGNAPLTVQFTGSADGGTTPYSYSWTFGDGSSSTAQSPSHTYTQAGTFTARLTVTDGDSNQNSTTETITVSSSTSSISAGIVASPTSGTVPLTVNFTGTADGGVSPYTYTWNFGDGDTGSGRIPSHTYNEAGSFQVVLTVRDSQNDQDTAYVTITGSAAVGNAQLLLSSSTGAPAPDSGGTISPQNGTHTYPIGTTVNITANPKPNYRFSRWAGSITEQKAGKHEINITLMGNRSLTAIFCSTCGDVNGDMNISPLDCQGIFDIFLGRNDSPTLCQKENADVNTDGSFITPNITPADAQAVFKQYLGKNSLPGDCSCTERMSTSLMGNPLIPMAEARRENHIFLEHDFIGAGNEIAVTIAVDNPAGIDAFGFDLVYPSDCLEFAGVVKSPLLEKFYQVDGNPKEADVIRIGGYGSDPIDDAFTNEFVVVIFKVKGFSENPIDFYIANTFDDLSLATIYTQTAMYTLNETTKEKDTNREYVRK
jgi:PKD repeat protein